MIGTVLAKSRIMLVAVSGSTTWRSPLCRDREQLRLRIECYRSAGSASLGDILIVYVTGRAWHREPIAVASGPAQGGRGEAA